MGSTASIHRNRAEPRRIRARLLGYERTRFAAERTLMAWVRTAVSLIAFGFSIPTLFDFLAEWESLKGVPGLTPRMLGTMLIGVGTLGLAGGIVEHVRLLAEISPRGRKRDALSAASITAFFVCLTGVVALINVVAR
jgi:putative membrane protein